MCVRVCMCVCAHIFVRACMCACGRMCVVCVHVCVHTCVRANVCVCACMRSHFGSEMVRMCVGVGGPTARVAARAIVRPVRG